MENFSKCSKKRCTSQAFLPSYTLNTNKIQLYDIDIVNYLEFTLW